MLFRLCRFLMLVLFKFYGRVRAVHAENIPETGGVILAPNHVSFADPPCVACVIKRQVNFMAKEELFKPPVFGSILRRIGTFPVRRGTADRRALKQAVDVLGQGRVVCIFPEGKRSEDGALQQPELGIGLVALKSGAPVVPVAVIGSREVLAPHAKFLHFHPIKVVYGSPITFPDLYDTQNTRAALEEVGRRVMSAIGELLEAEKQD